MESKKKFQLEELSKEFAREIKEVEESSDPAIIKANKLYYELKKERVETVLNAMQRGRPILEGPSCRRLFRAMGFLNSEYGAIAADASESYHESVRIANSLGFPADKMCDKIVVQMAGLEGGWAKPALILGDGHACEIDHQCCVPSMADMLNIPVFYVDFPLDQDDKPTLTSINYIADQYREFIEWVESKVAGIKYDEAKLIEMQEIDASAQKIELEIYKLVKHFPCPLSPQEAIQYMEVLHLEPSSFPNMQKAFEYIRFCRDELGERVARGAGPYPEERLRLLWAGRHQGFGSLSRSKLLLERKVAVPIMARGFRRPPFSSIRGALIGDVSRYGVKLSPLQEEAADLITDWLGGPGKRWVNRVLDLARDVGAQGIIHHLTIGCTPMVSMGTMMAGRAEKELGIPVLNVEGGYLDRDYMSQERFEEILSTFIDKCFDWAGKPRQ